MSFNQLVAFFLLVLGGVIIVWPRRKKPAAKPVEASLIKQLSLALLAALFFAGSFVLTKFIFNYQPFINGLIWTRLGGFLGAGLLILWPGNWRIILTGDDLEFQKRISGSWTVVFTIDG